MEADYRVLWEFMVELVSLSAVCIYFVTFLEFSTVIPIVAKTVSFLPTMSEDCFSPTFRAAFVFT